jgi:hypothetical protein
MQRVSTLQSIFADTLLVWISHVDVLLTAILPVRFVRSSVVELHDHMIPRVVVFSFFSLILLSTSVPSIHHKPNQRRSLYAIVSSKVWREGRAIPVSAFCSFRSIYPTDRNAVTILSTFVSSNFPDQKFCRHDVSSRAASLIRTDSSRFTTI